MTPAPDILRVKYKNYTIVPEFRISEKVSDYLKSGPF